MNGNKDLAWKVQEDLAVRSHHGTWGQPCVLLLVILTTDCLSRAPVLVWGACALMAIQTVLRLFLLKRMNVLYPRNPRVWEVLHLSLVMLCAGFWGAAASFAIWAYGYHDQNALVFFLCHAGIALGMVTVLVHNVRLMNIALALLYVPQVSAQLFLGGAGRWGPIFTILAYLLYISMQGRKLHEAYWGQIKANSDLLAVARHDYLTGLPNRLVMDEKLELSITSARVTGKRLALLYIDVDGFKSINDRHSHKIGDLFLREVAERLAEAVQSKGVAARLGGDEFTILVTECPSEEFAVQVADRVLCCSRTPASIEGLSLPFSVSVGVSLFPKDADGADHLVRAADRAMYVAKYSGKNRVRFFDSLRGSGNTDNAVADLTSLSTAVSENSIGAESRSGALASPGGKTSVEKSLS